MDKTEEIVRVEDDPSKQDLAEPPLGAVGGEAEQKMDQTNRRREATQLVKKIEECRTSSLQDSDKLYALVTEAKELLDQLLLHRAQGTDESKTGHVKSLKSTITMGDHCLQRWKEERLLLLSQSSKPVQTATSETTIQQSEADHRRYLRPVPQLPSFDGKDKNQWTWFWGLFNSAVHSNPYMSQADKLQALLPLLVDRAKLVVSGITIDPSNYELFVSTLIKEFDNRSERRKNLLEKLRNLPSMSLRDLEVLESQVFRLLAILRELEGLGVESNTDHELMMQHIEDSLPSPWFDAWQRKQDSSGDEKVYLKDLVLIIEKEFNYFRRSYDRGRNKKLEHREEKPVPVQPRFSEQRIRRHIPATSALPASVEESNSQAKNSFESQCPACHQKLHLLRKCSVFLSNTPEQRTSLVKASKLCFNCLHPHQVSNCRSRFRCQKCQKKHNTLLCYQREGGDSQQNSSSSSSGQINQTLSQNPSQSICTSVTSNTEQRTSESILLAKIGPSGIYQMSAVAYLHGGEGNQFQQRRVRLFFDSGSDTSFIRKEVVDHLQLPVVGSSVFTCVGVQGRTEPCRRYPKVSCQFYTLQGIPTAPCELWSMQTLCAPLKPRERPNHPELEGLFLADDFQSGEVDAIIGTDLFYKFVGHCHVQITPTLRAIETSFGFVIHGKKDGLNSDLIQRMSVVSVCNSAAVNLWELETLGIEADREEGVDNDIPSPIWNEKEKRYQVSLLWKSDDRPVSNKFQANKRLESMTKRLTEKQVDQYEEYLRLKEENSVIQVSPVTDQGSYHAFFLPHHGVHRGGKLRVVFDGSASDRHGKSLNSYISAGPNLLHKLFEVLLRFRVKEYAAQMDVIQAFHNLSLNECDRKYVQFLWKDRCYQFQRVPFGINCSPFLLNSVIQHHLRKNDHLNPVLIEMLRKGNYVDDLSVTATSRRQIECNVREANSLFELGGLPLSSEKTKITGDQSEPSKFLGVVWDTKADSLNVNPPEGDVPSSRRSLLSALNKVFDPLGILSPWTVRGKILFQESWKTCQTWDEPFEHEFLSKVKLWWSECLSACELRIPRMCFSKPSKIRVFCDASSRAYCSVIYIEGPLSSARFLCAKTRLAPLKPNLSVPRLELMAAVVGVRLYKTVAETLELKQLPAAFYSDSQDVLHWLTSDKILKTFVRNRVQEILSFTKVEQWFYISTKLNVADLGTRGVSAEILKDGLWTTGPDLSLLSQEPFVKSVSFSMGGEEEVEIQSKQVLIEAVTNEEQYSLILLDEVSSYQKLILRTAWVFRFVKNLKTKKEKVNQCTYGRLQPQEIECARKYWIKEEQSFTHDIESGRIPHRLRNLKPFVKEGITFAQPRTGETPVIILPRESRLTYLIVMDAHRRSFHQGVGTTASLLSGEYHVARSKVKQVLSDCRRCRRYRSLPFQGPEGGLPASRVQFTRCFAKVGIDFFGPIYVAGEKSYCLLITCFTSRAIHLEATESQSESDTANALRRFFALRGTPSEMLSDNARSFRLLSRHVPSTVAWKTIPERSPWFGGFYERMVAIVKRCLKITFHLKNFTFRDLQTTLYELSFFVNLRPLMKYNDVVLCPASFLYGVPEPIHVLRPSSVQSTEQHWRSRQSALSHLKARFQKEYLTTLRSWRKPNRIVRVPAVGDVVLVSQPGPRASWKLARVEELIVGSDGSCRAAFIKIGDLVTRRGLEKLYHLETVPVSDFIEQPEFLRKNMIEEEKNSEKAGKVPQLRDRTLETFKRDFTRTGREIKKPSRYND